MRAVIDYAKHAQECRRLAKLAPRPEDWGHFLEWLRPGNAAQASTERVRQQTVALADRFRNVLFLSNDHA